MAHALPNLTRSILGRPLAINPEKLQTILAVVTKRGPQAADVDTVEARESRPYQVDGDGIATVPVQGTLTSKDYGVDALSGLTSYTNLGAMLEAARSDDAVRGILLDVDSPGGDVSGLFELVDQLAAASAEKPVFAAVSGEAYSAAYALASQADRVFASKTSGVGSIGVVAAHVDQSQADAAAGLAYTFVYAGDRKIDGNSHQPLSPEATDDLRAAVDSAYAMFVDAVAQGRGISADAVRATQASTYFGFADAQAAGLVTDEGTARDARAALAARLNKTGDVTVTNPTWQERFEALRADHEKELAALNDVIAKFQAADAERVNADREAYVASVVAKAQAAQAPLDAKQVDMIRARFADDDDTGARAIGDAFLVAAQAMGQKTGAQTQRHSLSAPNSQTSQTAKPGSGWRTLQKTAR